MPRIEIDQATPEEVREWIREAVRDAVGEAPALAGGADALRAVLGSAGLLQSYTTKEVAGLLGMHDSDVRRIPGNELPKRKLGLGRSRNAYLGIDVLCYQLGIPPVDLARMVEHVRSEYVERTAAPAVRPMPRSRRASGPGTPLAGTKTRIL